MGGHDPGALLGQGSDQLLKGGQEPALVLQTFGNDERGEATAAPVGDVLPAGTIAGAGEVQIEVVRLLGQGLGEQPLRRSHEAPEDLLLGHLAPRGAVGQGSSQAHRLGAQHRGHLVHAFWIQSVGKTLGSGRQQNDCGEQWPSHSPKTSSFPFA